VAIHAGGSTGVYARDAFVNGIHTGLLCAAGAAILAALSVATLLKGEATTHQLADEDAQRQLAYVAEPTAHPLAARPSASIDRSDACYRR
jgi:small neutral amino acid transporter SnatA (MarC family)